MSGAPPQVGQLEPWNQQAQLGLEHRNSAG